MGKVAIAAMLATVLAVSAASAGPFEPERVPASAKWVAHIDVEAAMKTELMQFVMQQPKVMELLDEGVKKSVDKLGLDPTKDIKGVTLYGVAYEERNAIAIVHGKVDKEKLLALIPQDGHRQFVYNDVTVHSWAGATGKTPHGCFWGDDMVVLAGNEDNIKLAIDVLAGKKDNLNKGDLAAMLPAQPAGTVLVAAARDVVLPEKANRPHPFVSKLESGAIVAGENEGKVFVTISGQARDVKDAENFRTMLAGFVAMAQLAAAGDPDNPRAADAAELAKGVVIGGEGKTVTISVSLEVAKLKEIVERAKFRIVEI